jgi:short-subunit dehydrogenase
LTELAHAYLKTSSSGDALINISSSASFFPMPITSVYSASKAYVTMLSENLWYEQRRRGVYVLALCPGATESKFHSRAGGNNGDIPPWAVQTAEKVADITYRALKCRRKPVVVCGIQGPLIFFSKFIPRKWVILLAGMVTAQGAPKS